MSIVNAVCIGCGAKAAPSNPDEVDPLRWKMPRGWVLVPRPSGSWGRHCPGCNERDRQRQLAFARSTERMPIVMKAVLDFWQQYPERQLAEVIDLAAQLRRKSVCELDDWDLAGVLRIWTLSDAEREYQEQEGLPSLDPWTMPVSAAAGVAHGNGAAPVRVPSPSPPLPAIPRALPRMPLVAQVAAAGVGAAPAAATAKGPPPIPPDLLRRPFNS